jgi:aspartyl-tRNA(Asn)/glutamyl-tRNA(Gln) amidotransferase subunit C
MISKEEIKHIAHLGRLELSEEERKMLQKQLPEIIDFVGAFSDVSEMNINSGNQLMGLESIFREDAEHGLMEAKGQTLIEQAPKKRDSFVVVPEVLNSNKE